MKHFNQLTPEEVERLAILLEELGEAQQAIGKILRHGYESCHPSGGPTNREFLERELGDVRFCILLMSKRKDIDMRAIMHHAKDKEDRIIEYLHHT